MKEIDRFVQIRSNNLKPTKGRLLLSEPFMGDFFFGRSVVLLTEHNDEGSFGLIMNKPSETTFNELVKDFPTYETPIFYGGPVETSSLFFVHTLGSRLEGALQINDNLWWGGELEHIKEILEMNQVQPNEIRFFLGYSGWASNQLNSEIKSNSWVITKTNNIDLLSINPLNMWEKILNQMGKKYSYWTKFPIDPAAN